MAKARDTQSRPPVLSVCLMSRCSDDCCLRADLDAVCPSPGECTAARFSFGTGQCMLVCAASGRPVAACRLSSSLDQSRAAAPIGLIERGFDRSSRADLEPLRCIASSLLLSSTLDKLRLGTLLVDELLAAGILLDCCHKTSTGREPPAATE